MSHVSLNQLDVEADFWDYIACGKCSLPYSFDDPTSIPFWLTECGHVVCNNHISMFPAPRMAHVPLTLMQFDLAPSGALLRPCPLPAMPLQTQTKAALAAVPRTFS